MRRCVANTSKRSASDSFHRAASWSSAVLASRSCRWYSESDFPEASETESDSNKIMRVRRRVAEDNERVCELRLEKMKRSLTSVNHLSPSRLPCEASGGGGIAPGLWTMAGANGEVTLMSGICPRCCAAISSMS